MHHKIESTLVYFSFLSIPLRKIPLEYNYVSPSWHIYDYQDLIGVETKF